MVIPLTTMFLVLFMSHSNKNTVLNNPINARLLTIFMLVAVSINMVYRNYALTDTVGYINNFIEMSHIKFSDVFVFYKGEPLFLTLNWILAKIYPNPIFYLTVLWGVFLIPFMRSIFKLFKGWEIVAVLFTYFNFGFFYSYTTNVVRQGIALSLMMLALSYFINGEKSKKAYIALIIASFFHWSFLPFGICLFLLMRFNVKMKLLVWIWSILVVLYITNLNTRLIGFVRDYIPNIDTYTSTDVYLVYNKVNRLDFLAFSFLWLAVGTLLYFFVHRDETYKKILKVYVLFNSLYLATAFVAYSDRIAGFSWFLIPVLLWYPVVKAKKYNKYLAISIILVSFSIGWYSGLIHYYNPFQLFSKAD